MQILACRRRGANFTVGLAFLLSLSACQLGTKSFASTFRIRIPQEIAEGWSAPVAATFEGRVPSVRAFVFPALPSNEILAQLDQKTGILWLMGDLPTPGFHQVVQASEEQEPAFQVLKKAQGYLISEGERPIFFYQASPKSLRGELPRAGYVHPVYGLEGEVLTHDFPEDHPHHRGVFWAWHQLWVGDQRMGDPWLSKDFLKKVKDVNIVRGPLFSILEANVLWTSKFQSDESGIAIPLVQERVRIQAFISTPTHQVIDFHIQLIALVPGVRIGGSENPRGYSGFTVRIHASPDGRIHDGWGVLEEDRIGQSSPWAHYSGTFGAGDVVSGLGILAHPSLPEFPPRWLLRHYGMQNVVYPGRHTVNLLRDHPLDLHYRIIVHRGTFKDAMILQHQRVYEVVPFEPLSF